MSDDLRAYPRRVAVRRFGAWCPRCDDWARDVYGDVVQRASWDAAHRLASNHDRFDHRDLEEIR